jgi:multicomponent Na+:H+ antiporter subunit C
MTTALLYGLAGIGLAALGLRGSLAQVSLLRRLLALNLMGSGVFLMLGAVAYRGPGLPPDPVPQALVLTGIVVAVSATALALALRRRLREIQDHD